MYNQHVQNHRAYARSLNRSTLDKQTVRDGSIMKGSAADSQAKGEITERRDKISVIDHVHDLWMFCSIHGPFHSDLVFSTNKLPASLARFWESSWMPSFRFLANAS